MALFERGPQGPAGPPGKSVSAVVSVADDIATSAGEKFDRVRGIRGVPIDGSDGAPGLGASLVFTGASYERKKVFEHVHNVQDYGAIGDGVTDDWAAVMAAIAAAREGDTIYFPPTAAGYYFLSKTIHIYKRLEIVATGRNVGGSKSSLKFGYISGPAIHIWSLGSAYGGIGAGTTIKNLDIECSPLTFAPTNQLQPWNVAGGTAVVGERRRGKLDQNYGYLECIKAGTYPAAEDAPDATQAEDPTHVWNVNTPVYFGQRFRGTNNGATMAADGSNLISSVYFEVIAGPGVNTPIDSGSTFPIWNTTIDPSPLIGLTVHNGITYKARDASPIWTVEGTSVWRNRVQAGVHSNTRWSFEKLYVFAATNCSWCTRASAPDNANHSSGQDSRSVQCGHGPHVSGGDANVGHYTNTDVESPGYPFRDTVLGGTQPVNEVGAGGVGVRDASFLGCNWELIHVASAAWAYTDPSFGDYGGGPCVVAGGGPSRSTIKHVYSEGWPAIFDGDRLRPQIETPAVLIPGIIGNGISNIMSATIYGSSYEAFGARNVVGKAFLNNGKTISGGIGLPATAKALNWSHEDETAYGGLSWSEDFSGDRPPGFWTFGNGGAAFTTQAFGYPGDIRSGSTTARARWMSTVPVASGDQTVWFLGARIAVGLPSQGDPNFFGFAPAKPTSGHWVNGDFVYYRATSRGVTLGWRCTTSTAYSDPSNGTVSTEAVWEPIQAYQFDTVEIAESTLATSATTANQVFSDVPVSRPTSGKKHLFRAFISFIGGGAAGAVFGSVSAQYTIDDTGAVTLIGSAVTPTPDGAGALASSTFSIGTGTDKIVPRVTPGSATATSWKAIVQLEKLLTVNA